MERRRPKRVAHSEIFRNYYVERDPKPGFRLFRCDYEDIEDDEEIAFGK